MANLLNMSGGSLLGKGLPYDAEIEYLESTGTQWIFTDVYPGDTIGVSVEVMWDVFNMIDYESSFCGSRYNTQIRFYAPCVYGSKFAYGWNNWLETNIVAETMHKYSIQYNYMNNRKMIIDGIERVSLNETLPAFSSGNNLSIFSNNYNEIRAVALKGKIYRLTISDNTAIIHDYIPVRVGSTGYLYDKVSGQLFGNSGTGNFILGPDVDEFGVSYVDLGLPSGILWADRNIGANTPEETGLYFSWGNTDGHAADSGYNFSLSPYENTTGSQIMTDIPLSQDAANAYYGGDRRMPTRLEFQELYDNCDSAWVTENGVVGRRFTSKNNGNSIFFPASGYYGGTSLYYSGTFGYYWASSFDSDTSAYYLRFNNSSVTPQYTASRRVGFTVRAVKQ